MNSLHLLNKKLYSYILKHIYGLNLYKINLLLMVSNINIFIINNEKKKLKLSFYRLNFYIDKYLKIKNNKIILNKIKKFNLKLKHEKTFINKKNM